MDKEKKHKVAQAEKEALHFFQKMVDDKRAIRAYISKHGTLNGFKSESIKFVKPL